MTYRRIAVLASTALLSLIVLSGTAIPQAALAAGQPYSFNWMGTPAAPHSVVPAGWDTQIHARGPHDTMSDAFAAQHGADCGAPPATHTIQNLVDGVFICNNHLMTAVGDDEYGEIALTPDHMADWSSGTTTIQVSVSTNQFNSSDWIELWLTPFYDNQSLPFEPDIIDMQGPPRNALVFSFNASELIGSYSGNVTPIRNFVMGNRLPKLACTTQFDLHCINVIGHPSVIPTSSTTRAIYQIDISRSHVKFGLPGVVTWTDADYASPFTQSIVQLVHHSYNPLKHDPGTGIDTFHWSNFYISNAVPFTIINGTERSLHPADTLGCAGISCTAITTVHFPQPAPANSFLRFSGIGPQGSTYRVSYNGGATWVSPTIQPGTVSHDEHFTTYFTKIPAGTQMVMFQGQDWWGGPWWVRDPAIWSLNRLVFQTGGGSPPSRSPVNQVGPPPAPTPRLPTSAPANGRPELRATSGRPTLR